MLPAENAQSVVTASASEFVPGWWPGLDAAGNGYVVSGPEMTAVATALQGEAKTLADAVSGLVSAVQALPCGPDSWPEAATLRQTTAAVAGLLHGHTTLLATNVQNGGGAIEASNGRYAGAEDAGSAYIQQVGAPLSGSGPAGTADLTATGADGSTSVVTLTPTGIPVTQATTPVSKLGMCYASQPRTLKQLLAEAEAVDTGAMGAAATAWQRVSEALAGARDALATQSENLSTAWTGTASLGPQVQLQQAYASLSALSSNAATMARATNRAADDAGAFLSELRSLAAATPEAVSGTALPTSAPSGTAAAAEAAATAAAITAADTKATRLYDTLAANYTNTAFSGMPDELSIQYVPVDPVVDGGSPLTGAAAAGAALGGLAGAVSGSGTRSSTSGSGGSKQGTTSTTTGGTGGTKASGPTTGSGSNGPGGQAGAGGAGAVGAVVPDPYAGATQLAGAGIGGALATPADLSAPGMIGSGLPGVTGAGAGPNGLAIGGGLVAGGLAAAGLGRGLGVIGRGGALGGPTPAAAGIGPGGLITPVAGSAPGVVPGATATTGAAGRGMAGVPMSGGPGEEEDRQRSTWLAEDEDVWGATLDAVDGLITR